MQQNDSLADGLPGLPPGPGDVGPAEDGQAGPAALAEPDRRRHRRLAVDETVILLHPPLPLLGVSIVMKRER